MKRRTVALYIIAIVSLFLFLNVWMFSLVSETINKEVEQRSRIILKDVNERYMYYCYQIKYPSPLPTNKLAVKTKSASKGKR